MFNKNASYETILIDPVVGGTIKKMLVHRSYTIPIDDIAPITRPNTGLSLHEFVA